MARQIKRPDNSRGIGTKEGKGKQNRIEDSQAVVITSAAQLTPLLVDSTAGAGILGISLSTFYKFTRRNANTPMIQIGALHRWKKKDLLRFTAKPVNYIVGEDFLIDVKTAAMLCAVSRPMFYKLNQSGVTPDPILDGRTLRWSYHEIEEWIEGGCLKRVTKRGSRK